MISVTVFVFSGIVLVVLTGAKYVELRKKKTFFVLKAISGSDERLRDAHHKVLTYYSQGKDDLIFLINKQLPLKTKSIWNRSLAWSKDAGKTLIGDLRDSKLLKKRDAGISDFFKNIKEVKKGDGAIEEPYFDKPEIIEEVVEEQIVMPEMPVEEVVEVVEKVEDKPVKLLRKRALAKKPAKPRASRKKKLSVVEVE